MSDTNIFTSYIVKLAKENLAKLIFYVIAAIVAFAFLKWLIFGGFSIVFGAFFKLIGLGGHDEKDTIREQEVAIVQLEQANEVNTTTIAALQQSNENTQDSLQNHYEKQAQTTKAFNETRNKGQKAFNEANKGTKPKKPGGSGTNVDKTPSEASEEPSPLEDSQSAESLKLADAQFTMISEAYCLASPGACVN